MGNIRAKLAVGKNERELLWVDMNYFREVAPNNKPTSEVQGGFIALGFTAQADDDFFLKWMIDQREEIPYVLKDMEVIFYENDYDGTPLFRYRGIDAVPVYYREVFSNEHGMHVIVVFSPAVQHYKDQRKPFVKRWNESWKPVGEVKPFIPIQPDNTPKIFCVKWIDNEKSEIEETFYKEKIGLKVDIANPNKGNVDIKITKKDGSKFDDSKYEIILNKPVTGDTVVFTDLEIKEKWEEFKNINQEDELIAEAVYFDSAKQSQPLKITPSPKVLVNFRPHNNWIGEFGFDWIREQDTVLFNDNKFEDIVSKQYTDSAFTILEKDGNNSNGYFKKDENMFKKLQQQYKPFDVLWKKNKDKNGKEVYEKHYTQWLSLKKGDKADIKINIDITEEGDYLEFDKTSNFSFVPNKIDIKGKTGKINLPDNISIECKAEFSNDQSIVIKAYKENQANGITAGKINVWANQKTKHKKKKVVFVEIKTPEIIPSNGENKANASAEKNRMNQYLNQAYIELDSNSDIIDLDLTKDADFQRFVKNGRIMKESTAVPATPATATTPAKPAKPKQKLIDYLKKQLTTAYKNKYTGYFKAFYFAENGYSANGNLSGYSQYNADFVVVFASANNQTAVHEFLHSLNLAHTFTNSESTANAQYTYEAKKTDNLMDYSHNIATDPNNSKRCSLYYWQWKKANDSVK